MEERDNTVLLGKYKHFSDSKEYKGKRLTGKEIGEIGMIFF